MPKIIAQNSDRISVAALTGFLALIGSILANVVFIQGQVDRTVMPLERRMERVENKIDDMQDKIGGIYREMSRAPDGAWRRAAAGQ